MASQAAGGGRGMRPKEGTSDHSTAHAAEAVSGARLQTVTGVSEPPRSTGNVVGAAEPSEVVGPWPLGSQAGRSAGRQCGKPSGCRPQLCVPVCVRWPPRWGSPGAARGPRGAREIRACPHGQGRPSFVPCPCSAPSLQKQRHQAAGRLPHCDRRLRGWKWGPKQGGPHAPCAPPPTCSVQSQLGLKPPSRERFPSFSQRDAVSSHKNRVSVTWGQPGLEAATSPAAPHVDGGAGQAVDTQGPRFEKPALGRTRGGVQASREGAAPEREGIPEAAGGPLRATHGTRVHPASGLGVGRRLEQLMLQGCCSRGASVSQPGGFCGIVAPGGP